VFSVLYAAVLIVQLAVGAYRAERGNYPDEAAHFMNALLVRDYLTQGLGQNPLRFAEEYYLNYPKIAPGMWPPLFHGVLGLVMLLGTPPRIAGLALLALAPPVHQVRTVQTFPTQQRTQLAVLLTRVGFLEDATPVLGRELSALDLCRHFRIGVGRARHGHGAGVSGRPPGSLRLQSSGHV